MAKTNKGVKGVDRLKLHHVVEYALARFFLGGAALFGIDAASAIGGFLGRTFGPLLPPNKTADRNLELAMPELSEEERKATLKAMWDNFGRTIFELPLRGKFIPYIEDSRVEVVGGERLDEAAAQGKGLLCISGHFANWEILAAAIRHRGLDVNGVYRSANNPLINDWIIRLRTQTFTTQSPKGTAGAKSIVQSIRANTPVAMLIDQKMNDGMDVPFFGRNARTPGAPAQLAEKYDCPILPFHAVRLKGAHFRVTIYPQIEVPRTGNKPDDVLAIATACNRFLEDRIREVPSQWMWMHNRWSDSKKARKRKERKRRQGKTEAPKGQSQL